MSWRVCASAPRRARHETLRAQGQPFWRWRLLKIWDETASTVLFVTHDVDEAIYLADRIYIMCAGPVQS